MFLEAKKSKNHAPKLVFNPNRILKNHHFGIQALIVWNPCTKERAQLTAHHDYTRELVETMNSENFVRIKKCLRVPIFRFLKAQKHPDILVFWLYFKKIESKNPKKSSVIDTVEQLNRNTIFRISVCITM